MIMMTMIITNTILLTIQIHIIIITYIDNVDNNDNDNDNDSNSEACADAFACEARPQQSELRQTCARKGTRKRGARKRLHLSHIKVSHIYIYIYVHIYIYIYDFAIFIGWSNKQLNNLHVGFSLETQQELRKLLNHWLVLENFWDVGCWNGSTTLTWSMQCAAEVHTQGHGNHFGRNHVGRFKRTGWNDMLVQVRRLHH